jgi:hypothetical protein
MAFSLILILDLLPDGRVDKFDGPEVDEEETDTGVVELVLQKVLRNQDVTNGGDEHVGTDQALDYGEPFFREEPEPDGRTLDRSRASRKVDQITFGSDVKD